ncbi:MAG TPA: MFS transporter [Burkholderiales bacterium]|nr:MFS transporter [Burkholderiales bacterium]
MQRDSHNAAQGSAFSSRPLQLYEVLAIVLVWNSGYKGLRVLNTLYALELGAGPLETGLLLATYGVFPLLLAVHVGRLGDRYGVRTPAAAGMIVSVCGALLPFLWPALPALFAAAAVTGTGFILTQVSMQALVGGLGGAAARTRNINLYALVVSSCDLIGPVAAGFSIDHFGHVRTYLYLALAGAAPLLALAALFARFPPAAAAAERGARRTADLVRDPNLRRMLVASAVIIASLDLFQVYLPVYAHSIGHSASTIGLILGAFAAAGFVTRALMPALVARFGEERTLTGSMLVTAVTFLLIPQFEAAPLLAAVCFLLGLGMGLGQPLTVILTYASAPAGRAGEALGLRIAVTNSIHVVAPSAFGALGSAVGLAPVFWASGAILALGGYAARPAGPRTR